MSLPKPCAEPTCPEVVEDDNRCNRHRKEAIRRDRRWRGSSTQRGYGRRHRKWRKRILRRDPLCIHCLGRHEITPSTVADHITPIRKGGARFDMANGQGLCESCHNRKTAMES